MRIDLLLVRLRLCRSRTSAQALIAAGTARCNGQRVQRASQPVGPGDVLTLPLGREVRIVEVLALPARRGPPAEAQACYRMLDPAPQSAIAAVETGLPKGITPP